jgi:uncharacterized protein
MSRVIHFEFPVDDAERAISFYRDVFGWQINKWEGPEDYWLVMTGSGQPGIDGAFMRRGEGFQHTVNTIGVESRDDAVAKIEAAGGKILMKMTVPGVGYMAYALDTEGNSFGIMQSDTSAG